MEKSNNMWIWGYVLKEIPGNIPFVYEPTCCSLETATKYLNADNAVYMNSTSSMESLNDEEFKYMADCKNVICGLEHNKYAESAVAVSKFSLTHKNIKGAIIDDFLEENGPSKVMSVAELKEIYMALKSVNKDLKLYVVRYSRHNLDEIDPYLDYIDGINFWVWVSTDHYWRYQYMNDIYKLSLKGKPILQGVFLHNYGEDYAQPIPLDMLKLQLDQISKQYKLNNLEGCIFLQNGWMDKENHREVVQYTKDYLEWLNGTITRRN